MCFSSHEKKARDTLFLYRPRCRVSLTLVGQLLLVAGPRSLARTRASFGRQHVPKSEDAGFPEASGAAALARPGPGMPASEPADSFGWRGRMSRCNRY